MKIIKKEEHSVLYDLGALQNGALTFSYAAKEGRGAECFYGPYPDFIIFRCTTFIRVLAFQTNLAVWFHVSHGTAF